MNVQYGVIQVDSTIIRRKFRAPSVDSYAIDNSQTTTYDEYYTLNQDCWAIHKILFNTSSLLIFIRHPFKYILNVLRISIKLNSQSVSNIIHQLMQIKIRIMLSSQQIKVEVHQNMFSVFHLKSPTINRVNPAPIKIELSLPLMLWVAIKQPSEKIIRASQIISKYFQ